MMHRLFLVFLAYLSVAYSSPPSASDGRIFGGITADSGAFPWMVSLRIRDPGNLTNILPICAGSILSETFVLTAASCFLNYQSIPLLFSIRAGINDFFNPNVTAEQIRQVSAIDVHPSYNATGNVNDITVVRLATPLIFNPSSVWNISLSNVSDLADLDLTAVGWGVLNQSNPTLAANFLQQIVVQEDVNCTMDLTADPTTQLCATGTCLGDGGGPLMIESNVSANYELVGVTTYRQNCNTNGIFTRVQPFLDWIEKILNSTWTTTAPATIRTTIRTTTTTTTFGPPIPFVCNTSYTCGCSPVPVVFHDDPAVQARIVGGEEAQPFSWSWQVSIHAPPLAHTCGGSIINDRWVLAAAHCLLVPNQIFVRVSVHDKLSLAGQDRNVVDVIRHPDFNGTKFINDIALLRLASPIILSQTGPLATTTCLPAQTDNLEFPQPGTRLAVIGWGRLIENGPVPNRLQQVRVTTLRNDDWRCINATSDQQRQFCAMVDGGGKDSCQGDSGGPIHQWLDDHWEQVGIVSYGKGCAEPNNTGVYTRLAFYHDWIHNTIRDAEANITTTATGPTTRVTMFHNATTIANSANSTVNPQTINSSQSTTVRPCSTTESTIHSNRSTPPSTTTGSSISSAISTVNTNPADRTTVTTGTANRTGSTAPTSQGRSVYHHGITFFFHSFFTALPCIALCFFFG